MIKILFFAQLREQLGSEGLDWPITDSLRISELCEQLIEQNPTWATYLRSQKILCALNQTMVKFSAQVSAGDEVAFFPPVTGG